MIHEVVKAISRKDCLFVRRRV